MAPNLTAEDVRRIAALARLDLSPDDAARFAPQLAGILAYADAVRQVDTRTVQTTAADEQFRAPLRDDEPRPSLDRATVLDQAPDARREAGLYRVPKVL